MNEDKENLQNVIKLLQAQNKLAEVFKDDDLEYDEYLRRVMKLDLETLFIAMYHFTKVMSGTYKSKLNHLISTIEDRNKMIEKLEKMIKE